MKKIFAFLLMVFCMILLNDTFVYASENNNSQIFLNSTSNESAYQFPLTTDDPDWKELCSTAEMYAAYQIPEEVMETMSTKALIETVLNNSFMTQFAVYENSMDAINVHEQVFNIYNEMENRPDYYEALTELYQNAHIMTDEEYGSTSVEPYKYFYTTNLEFLLAAEIYRNEHSKNISLKRTALTVSVEETYKRNQALRQSQEIYGALSDGFYWFYNNLPDNEIEGGTADTVLGDIVARGESSTTTKTPNGTVVQVAIIDELSAETIDKYDEDYAKLYPAATKLYHATNRFNCHSYAWYSQSMASNKYWIRNPKAYWEDGSYKKCGIKLNCKVRYLSGLHSAIVSYYDNGMTYYTSKWGNHGLYYHAPNYGPAFGAMQGVEYYTR